MNTSLAKVLSREWRSAIALLSPRTFSTSQAEEQSFDDPQSGARRCWTFTDCRLQQQVDRSPFRCWLEGLPVRTGRRHEAVTFVVGDDAEDLMDA